jgi:ABC-type multidrug transport system fused ATPase/permease subunit
LDLTTRRNKTISKRRKAFNITDSIINYTPEDQRVRSNTSGNKTKKKRKPTEDSQPVRPDLFKDILLDMNIDPDKIIPLHDYPEELEYGPVEYKLKLKAITMDRIEQLTTQMKFRLQEGGGECVYHVGLLDNGDPLGINEDELKSSLETLCFMTKKLEASMDILTYTQGKQGLIAEVLIKKPKLLQEIKHKNELKVGLVGEAGSGKSTLVRVEIII